MTFSDAIIQGDLATIKARLAQHQELNALDEYGYTPLIQAAIHNHTHIALLLLEHGAKPDPFDHSGQNALHWAIDNDNIPLIKHLIAYKADPNAHTTEGQSPLFKPLLRKNQIIVDRLIKAGADLNFAKDYINAKLIGHRFELTGTTDVFSPQGLFLDIDMEGFYLEFSIELIRESLTQFLNSYTAHRLELPLPALKSIINAFSNASALRVFKHYSKKIDPLAINPLLQKDLLLLPVSYRGHAISFVKHKDFWAKCDRGVQKSIDPIVIYKMDKHPALDFYRDLLYTRQTDSSLHQEQEALALQTFSKLPIRHQITGNCSWANIEASVPVMLFMQLYQPNTNQPDLMHHIINIHKTWLEWDKDRALEECLLSFKEASFNRKKAKATLLGALLFQACNYTKPNDVARARKILAILLTPAFQYVLKSYIKVFIKDKQGKGPNAFYHLLKKCGVNLADLE